MRNYNMSRETANSCTHMRNSDCMQKINCPGNMNRTGEQTCMKDPNCIKETPCMRCSDYMQNEYVVGMAYVPWQYFTTVYETDKALEAGTIFPELDKPFWAGKGMCRK